MAFFGFSSRRYEMLVPAVLLVCATRCTANCVALEILIGTYPIIYVLAEVMPAFVFARPCKLLYMEPMLTRNYSVTQQSSGTELHFRLRVPLHSSGWIASPATRDCLSWHWISCRLLSLKPMLNDYSHCVVI